MLKRYIGDRQFYKMVMAVAVPIMIQNFISNFVGMLDNIMVGQVGTAQMSGVSIVNRILFVFYLCVFGAVAGAGIFTAQYSGSGNDEGVRYTFRYKFYAGFLLTALGCLVFTVFAQPLIMLFLQGEGTPEEAAEYLACGREYMAVMLLGLLPFAISSVYSSTLRECGETVVPMVAGVSAVVVNLALNWVLIFGNLGAPELGIRGAAAATVISRFVELGIVAVWTHTHESRMPFARGLYSSLRIPGKLGPRILKKGAPLLVNEALWSLGTTMLIMCYSLRSLEVVGAVNIADTVTGTMSVALLAMGSAVGIIIGRMLGARRPEEETLDATRKLAFFSVSLTLVFSLLQTALAGVFPLLYNTSDSIRRLAGTLMIVYAVVMPARAFTNVSYFTLRSGGQTVVTFLFDSCFVWAVSVPTAFVLARFTGIPIVPLVAVTEGTEFLKCILGYIMLKQRRWMKTIID